MSEHNFEDELEERDDVVDTPTGIGGDGDGDGDDAASDGEPWAKTSSGNADDVTTEDEEIREDAFDQHDDAVLAADATGMLAGELVQLVCRMAWSL